MWPEIMGKTHWLGAFQLWLSLNVRWVDPAGQREEKIFGEDKKWKKSMGITSNQADRRASASKHSPAHQCSRWINAFVSLKVFLWKYRCEWTYLHRKSKKYANQASVWYLSSITKNNSINVINHGVSWLKHLLTKTT